MKESKCKLSINVTDEDGHFKVDGNIWGETELIYYATVYALSVIARQVVSPKTISSRTSTPVSDWSMNEYRKEFVQEVCESTYKLLCNVEKLDIIEREGGVKDEDK